MTLGTRFTLVRFRDAPEHITAVAQVRSAQEALGQFDLWAEHYPADTTVVFDPRDHYLTREQLELLAAGPRPSRSGDALAG